MAKWAKMIGTWIDQLDPVTDNKLRVWNNFLTQFDERSLDTTHKEEANNDIKKHLFLYPI
jgi:hypothetical protein